MKIFKSSILLVSAFTLLLTSNAEAEELTKHVIVVSFDGLMPKMINSNKTPFFKKLINDSSYTFNAKTIFPSYTLPSHTSMLTGVGPKKHNVYWNSYNPFKKIKTKTIFSYAKSNNLSTTMFVNKKKFFHFDKNNSIDLISHRGYTHKSVLPDAKKYIINRKPNLSFVHIADMDSIGHGFGWDTDYQRDKIKEMDQPFYNFIQDIRKNIPDVIFIISADHGGHGRTHGSRSKEDMTIPWIINGKNIKENNEISYKVRTFDTAATALWLLGIEIPEDFDGQPVEDVIKK